MAVSAGTRLGPYEILEPLGAGGMGEVYRARDTRLGREVAVKVLRSEVASDPDRLRRFEREAKTVAALNHPHILTVFDVGTHEGTPYVVTELLEGETLRQVLKSRTPTQTQVLGFAVQIARGLAAAHDKDIVHRDLKPENLFVTTDGRIKILDFGLAKLTTREADFREADTLGASDEQSTSPGVILGTVAYMSPEQAQAHALDNRSDIFSFGVVLYEMLAHKHPFLRDTAPATLTAIVNDAPPDLASSGRGIPPALARIVGRCLEKEKQDRFRGTHDLALALEAVLQTPGGAPSLQEVEERSPYPGLSAFTERDAAVFFGREAEVETLWRKLRSRHLLAVIGPSGAGKSSFVHAGILSARPEGWARLVCTPGRRPFRRLGQALAPALQGDAEALTKLVSFDEPDTALELLTLWRKGHAEALVVVDQFEELFTQTPPEAQAAFAELLGRLSKEADVHVLLSLRDDFLMRCHPHQPLARVFSELTPLDTLSRVGLVRAITEPARKRGYAFEDEALVDEMVDSVEGARGALPLLAFAVARLWEERDRKTKLLTRAAYEEIGGVAGALAQHAEQTLERIGLEREPIVRELFRNLVTAQWTRAAAEREELLSVLPDRDLGGQVLDQLIDARLLTSYEVREAEDIGRHRERGVERDLPSSHPERGLERDLPSSHPERGLERDRAKDLADDRTDTASALATTHHRIEIVHESLLKAWPRLVRWQAQDEEGAVLRDQLKQAAHLWDEKGRPEDLLWTGASEREFEVWRERYPGQLTAVEDGFAEAMVARARRRQRRRRAIVAASFAALALVLAVVTGLLERARLERRRAEASKLVALGRNELERYPLVALAYARKSLGIADNVEARQLVMAVLWRSPPGRVLRLEEFVSADGGSSRPSGTAARTTGGAWRVAFSPDGRRFAAYCFSGDVLLYDETGGRPRPMGSFPKLSGPPQLGFSPDGRHLVGGDDRTYRVVQIPEGLETARFDVTSLEDGRDFWWALGPLPQRFLVGVRTGEPPEATGRVVALPYEGGDPEIVGSFSSGWPFVHPSSRQLAVVRPEGVFVRPLRGDAATPERRVLHLTDGDDQVLRLSFNPDGTALAVGQASGRLRLVASRPDAPTPSRSFQLENPDLMVDPSFDATGRRLAWGSSSGKRVAVWDLEGPSGAEPLALLQEAQVKQAAWHPAGTWLAVAQQGIATFWALGQPRPYVLRRHRATVYSLTFTPDSKRLVSGGTDGARLWPLDGEGASGPRRLETRGWCYGLAVTPDGENLIEGFFGARLYPLSGGGGRWIMDPSVYEGEIATGVAIDPSGRWVATSDHFAQPPGSVHLRLWELASGRQVREWPLIPEGQRGSGFDWGAPYVAFAADGRIVAGGRGGIRRFDPVSGRVEWILKLELGNDTAAAMAVSADGRHLFAAVGSALLTGGSALGPRYLVLVDLSTGETRRVVSLGTETGALAIGPRGRVLVTADKGFIRVASSEGGEPHLLMGAGTVMALAVSPDGRWIASASGAEVRLWPMPDLSKTPFHTLPYEELMTRLGSLTNLRAVPDAQSPGGYKIEVGPFPGWADVPTW